MATKHVQKDTSLPLPKEKLEEEFKKIGLDSTNTQNILKTPSKATNLHEVIVESGINLEQTSEEKLKTLGNLLYTLSNKIPVTALRFRKNLAVLIGNYTLKNVLQLDAAIEYARSISNDPTATIESNMNDFNEKCGIGIELNNESISSLVNEFFAEGSEARKQLTEEKYQAVSSLLAKLRKFKTLKWADGKVLKESFDAKVLELIGAKPENNEKSASEKTKKPANPEKNVEVKKEVSAEVAAEEEETKLNKFIGRELPEAQNSKRLLDQRNEITGGKIYTRFPPEPNGYLHIGHAKAMNLSFGYAQEMGGETYLRYDDTNPDAEKVDYIRSIKETVAWLGWKPFKITYSSDYFDKLYEYAIVLIKKGLAYVDHQTPDEMSEYRANMKDSPWRDRPLEENLKLFEDMRKGKFAEGKATLRLKMDMKSDNYTMRDLVAYRIKYTSHPHIGDKWCIYPSYDYTHCIVDSLEYITHSLCTLEFEVRRDPYYWILNALDIYRPNVWEFSRLNLTTNVMSKRRLNKLVTQNFVDGWDDPRILTVDGLKRRGYTPSAINKFCRAVGVTRNENIINIQYLEHFCRQDLDENAPRGFAVLHPLKVTISNFPDDKIELRKALNFPAKKEAGGEHSVPLSKVIYIERSDFRLQDSKDYYGLAPGKEVLLKYAYNIKCVDVVMNTQGSNNVEDVKEIVCTIDFNNTSKPKGTIHWIGKPSLTEEPFTAEIRVYDYLFNHENPSGEEDWIKLLNSNSKVVIKNAFVDPFIFTSSKLWDKFQFERLGFFSVDPDSVLTNDSNRKLVFNSTVSLKQSKEKKALETTTSSKN